MEKKDLERFAFLYLCGSKDRNILTGKEKMKFSDFYRLTYITEFLGLNYFNLFIRNQFAGQFKEALAMLDQLVLEHDLGFDMEEYEDEYSQQEIWIQEFCSNAPNSQIRKELKGIVQRIYKEKDYQE